MSGRKSPVLVRRHNTVERRRIAARIAAKKHGDAVRRRSGARPMAQRGELSLDLPTTINAGSGGIAENCRRMALALLRAGTVVVMLAWSARAPAAADASRANTPVDGSS